LHLIQLQHLHGHFVTCLTRHSPHFALQPLPPRVEIFTEEEKREKKAPLTQQFSSDSPRPTRFNVCTTENGDHQLTPVEFPNDKVSPTIPSILSSHYRRSHLSSEVIFEDEELRFASASDTEYTSSSDMDSSFLSVHGTSGTVVTGGQVFEDSILHAMEKDLPDGGNWVVQKFGGTSVGKFANGICDIVR
jgi:hypothetical protein